MNQETMSQIKDLNIGEVTRKVKRRFDDKPIGTRLHHSYLFMALIVLLIAAVAIWTNVDASNRLKTFKNIQMAVVDAAWSARSNLSELEKNAYWIFLSDDLSVIEKCADEMEEDLRSLNESVSLLKELADKESGIDTSVLGQLEQAVSKAGSYMEQALKSRDSGNTMEAFAAISQECAPLVEASNGYLEKLTNQAKEKANQYISNSSLRMWFFIGFLVLVTLFMIGNMLRLAKRIIRGISEPLKEVERALGEMENGNLDFELTYRSNNEIGHLAHMVRKMEDELRKYIDNIDTTLDCMANKDFTVSVDMEYKGNFKNIKISLEKIIDVLNGITSAIRRTAENVSDGSKQIAEASQSLAEGATDQSSSVEELLATVSDISERVDKNAEDITNVSEKSDHAQKAVDEGNEQMNQLMEAMADIETASKQISEIINVIEGISGQTNMLALNASIEAARAGEHGKGFAVVAGEIGQLSGETKEATKNTASLIHQSLAAVERGVSLAKNTAQALLGIVDATRQIKVLANQVSQTSLAQAESLNQVSVAVQTISDVASTNASVAQETAASSSELTNHAERLAETLNEFTLKQ